MPSSIAPGFNASPLAAYTVRVNLPISRGLRRGRVVLAPGPVLGSARRPHAGSAPGRGAGSRP